MEEVRWAYEPAASDPVKAILRNDVLMSDPMRYFKTVSYTHLDVYKRQPFTSSEIAS